MISELKKQLRRHEGEVEYAYQDSEGYWTIGVGHLIDKRKGGKLPKHFIDMLLEYDIFEKIDELDKGLPVWRSLDDVRQRVIVDMAFNLGVSGVKAFKRMWIAIEAQNYPLAATEMLDSKWASQVGSRATRLAEMMKTGEDV